MKVVVPSKGRSDTIGRHTLALFPEALVVVDEAEADDYLRVVPGTQLVTHPGVQPVGRIMNWILDNVKDDVVVVVDDDVTCLRAMPGWRPRTYRDPQVAREVLESTAQCAIDAGARLFGFNQCPYPAFYKPHAPIRLNRWVGTVIGHVGDHGLRFDEKSWRHGDAELCLQSLLKHRIVWCDERWAFVGYRLTNTGGNTGQRDAARDEEERAYLKKKWGRFIGFSTRAVRADRRKKVGGGTGGGMTLITSLRVPRKQAA